MLGRLRSLARSAARRFDGIDIIASPTLCVMPPLISEIGEAQSYLDVNRRIVRNTVAVNYLGLCGITLPIGSDSLCPDGQKSGFLRLRSAQSG
jgi:aspartyl-tRNA(Asn)/glutamyl-tRNA(Gln) amidotransferase subunit A